MQGNHGREMPYIYMYSWDTFPQLWRKKGRRKGEGWTWTKSPKLPFFWHILKMINTITFAVHGHLSWFMFGTPSQGPKGLYNVFFRNWTMEMWPWSVTMENALWHGTTSWSMMWTTPKISMYYLVCFFGYMFTIYQIMSSIAIASFKWEIDQKQD